MASVRAKFIYSFLLIVLLLVTFVFNSCRASSIMEPDKHQLFPLNNIMRFYYKFDCTSLLAIEFYIRLNLMRMKTIERISFENNGNMSRLLIVYDVWIAAAAAAAMAVSPPSPLPDFFIQIKTARAVFVLESTRVRISDGFGWVNLKKTIIMSSIFGYWFEFFDNFMYENVRSTLCTQNSRFANAEGRLVCLCFFFS